MEDVDTPSAAHNLRHRVTSNGHKSPHDDSLRTDISENMTDSSGSDSPSDTSTDRFIKLGEKKASDFMVEGKLVGITDEAHAAFEQLQERFSQEYKSLLQNVASSAGRVYSADSRVPDRVNFSFNVKTEARMTKKRFTTRESVLTELFKVNHIRTVYNIFIAILIIFSVQTVIYDLLERGRINIDFEMIVWGFGKFSQVLTIWFCMQASILAVFPAFNIWIQLRESKPDVIDKLFLLLYIFFLAAILSLPVWSLFDQDIPPISSVIVTMEQTRMVMKVHSFVRENAPRVLYPTTESTDGLNFSSYIYFLFAPTLIYRDEYPRTRSVNWSQVAYDVFQLIVSIFYIYYIFIRFCVPLFHNFSSDHITMRSTIVCLFGCMLPATLVLLIGFYTLLHCWLNAWAEMLTFGDRLFYQDWWNSTNFSGYYRMWNIVVHDWLYSYVYQDSFMLFGFKKQYRIISMYLTFLISAMFHEFIISVSFRFFYPVLFVCFGGFGVSFIFVPGGKYKNTSNIFMWLMLMFGNGVNLCFYSMEWFSRRNCQPVKGNYLDWVIPHSWFCESIRSNVTSDMIP